jgi:hypothetical protein
MKSVIKLVLLLVTFFSLGRTAWAFDLSVKDTKLSASGGTVLVEILGAKNLGALDLKINYDAAVLKFNSVELGRVSKSGMVDFKNENGVVTISLVDTDGISKDGELLKLSFNVLAKSGASSKLGVLAKAFDTDLKDIQVRAQGGTITVGGGGVFFIVVAVLVSLVVATVLLVIFRRRKLS